MFKDKDVVIIGNGSTGCDLAVGAVEAKAKSVTIIYRSKKWIPPKNGILVLTNKVYIFLRHKSVLNTTWKFPKISLYVLKLLFLNSGIMNKLPDELINRDNLALNDKIFKYFNKNKIKYTMIQIGHVIIIIFKQKKVK